MNGIRYLVLRVIFQAVFLWFIASNASAADTINIGVVGSMKFDYGKELWNGAIMAADEINKRGGVRVGQKRLRIKLVKANSNEFMNIAYATNTMEMLFFRNKVDFVIGGFRSEAVLAMQDVAMDYKKIFISIGAALPELCNRVAQNYDRYKYYFRNGTFNSHNLAKACFLQLDFVANALREKLGTRNLKVAIAAEKASWVEGMIVAAKKQFPQMGLDLVGVYRVSSVATDVSAEIKSIAKSRASMVFTLFSSTVGIPFVVQAADFKLPAAMVGINVEAQNKNFWNKTEGKAQYVMTTSSFCNGVEITKLTKPFIKNFQKRFGKLPTYTAGTYTAITHTIVPAIEQAGSLDPDILVNIIENRKYETPYGFYAYDKDELGRHLHDLKFGADYAMLLGVQWQNGELVGVWPSNYIEKPGDQPLTYRGIVPTIFSPLVIATNQR